MTCAIKDLFTSAILWAGIMDKKRRMAIGPRDAINSGVSTEGPDIFN
jgi:hypothetical protein